MKKGLALIHNKDERTVVRSALNGFNSFALHGNLRDGLEDIKKNKGAFDLLILDERFDQSQDSRNEALKIIDLLEAFQAGENRAQHAVVMVILNESTTLENPVQYSELGVDLFLRRPFGSAELREKLNEAATWVESPPPIVKLLKVFQEGLRRGRHDEIVGGLESLFEKSPQSIRVGMLLARALMKRGPEGRKRAIGIVRDFDNRYPESHFSKKLLIEGYRAEKLIDEACRVALRLYGCSSTPENFDQVVGLANELSTANDVVNLDPWLAILEELKKQELIRTKDRRVRVLREITQRKPNPQQIAQLIQFLEQGQEDILPQVKDSIEAWIEAIQQSLNGQVSPDPQTESAFVAGLKMLLDIEPGLPSAIETFTDIQIRHKNYKAAEKYLLKAREKQKTSVQFYSAFAKLALEENNLKEASDMVHAGRKMAPSDDRWNALAAIWSEKYAKAQQTTGSGN